MDSDRESVPSSVLSEEAISAVVSVIMMIVVGKLISSYLGRAVEVYAVSHYA